MMKIIFYFLTLFYFGTSHLEAYTSTFEVLQNLDMVHHLKEQDLQKKFLDTSAGRIAYFETSGEAGPVVLIHGNSCSKEFMIRQLDGLGLKYKMIALDLPGHGESSDALNPSENYTLTGYAHVVAEVIRKLYLKPVVLVGWSIGGDISLEMMGVAPELLKGVLISGAPPIVRSEQGIKEGYLPFDSVNLVSKLEQFTHEDVKAYWAHESIDLDKYPILAEACMRTHGLARYTMGNAFMRGEGINEKELVGISSVPLGIIMGADDFAVNNDYIQSLDYANCKMMKKIDGGHDCLWSHSMNFNQLLDDFAEQLSEEEKPSR
jgi:pimeloyl-ACP methyl ester carboxylesterase